MKKLLLNQAITLRQKGHSFKEISDALGISKSTASLWTQHVVVGQAALERLKKRELEGRTRGFLSNQAKRKLVHQEIAKRAEHTLKNIELSKVLDKLLCSLLYWCEGEKTASSLAFTNSDRTLIATFLRLFRSGFSVDEKKFRVYLHLHAYHDEQKQKQFWSKITGIPVSQFSKVYQKRNTGLTKKEGYQGCVSVRYYDHTIAKEIACLWQSYATIGA